MTARSTPRYLTAVDDTWITSAGWSHVGGRSRNEDAFCHEPDIGLFAVADGMGGHHGGAVASRLAIDTVLGSFKHPERMSRATAQLPTYQAAGASRPDRVHVELHHLLSDAIDRAQARIRARQVGEMARMGTTFTAMAVRDQRAVIAQVGDSRLYRLRGRQLDLLTPIHTLYDALAEGGLDMPARGDFAFSNVLTKALGKPEFDAADMFFLTPEPGDTYLLCTDGLDKVPLPEVAEILATSSPKVSCVRLVRAALAHGSTDNITTVVVRFT